MAEELTEGGEDVATVEGQPPVADPPTEAMPPEGASAPPPAAPSVPPPADPSMPPPEMAAAPDEPEVSSPPPAAEPAPSAGKKKRRKIDLKSRLSSVRASGSMAKAGPSDRKSDPLSFPPPPASSVPAPKIGPISSPLISSAFAPPEPEKKPTAQQQTIKVEVGEEIVQERKKASKRTAVLVALGALVAGGLGFAVGGVQARGAMASKAKDGSKELAENVDAANAELVKLSDGLRKANESIQLGEFPAELVELLKKTSVPFDAEMMKGKNVGQLPALAFNKLLSFSEGAQRVNDQKDDLRKKLEAAQKPIEARIAESKAPKYKYGIVFSKKKDNYLAEILLLKDGFETDKEEWPEELTLLQGKKPDERKEVSGTPWNGKSKLEGGETKQVVIVGPESSAPPAPPESVKVDLQLQRLLTSLRDMRILIDGNPSPNPSLQSDGLIKTGEILSEELKKVYNR